MNKKLLTLEDLYSFYSQKKKSMSFSADKSGYNIAVQSLAKFELNDDLSEGLLYGKIRAFHDLTNNNKSHIETDVLEEKMMSIKDLAYLYSFFHCNYSFLHSLNYFHIMRNYNYRRSLFVNLIQQFHDFP